MTKGSTFGENKYKTAFFSHEWLSLNELPYLIHWKHFVDVFLLIIVTVTSRNIIFFVLMKKNKTLNMSRDISHYVQILHTQPFNKIRGTVGSISDWVSEKFYLETTWGFSWKNVKLWLLATILHNMNN